MPSSSKDLRKKLKNYCENQSEFDSKILNFPPQDVLAELVVIYPMPNAQADRICEMLQQLALHCKTQQQALDNCLEDIRDLFQIIIEISDKDKSRKKDIVRFIELLQNFFKDNLLTGKEIYDLISIPSEAAKGSIFEQLDKVGLTSQIKKLLGQHHEQITIDQQIAHLLVARFEGEELQNYLELVKQIDHFPQNQLVVDHLIKQIPLITRYIKEKRQLTDVDLINSILDVFLQLPNTKSEIQNLFLTLIAILNPKEQLDYISLILMRLIDNRFSFSPEGIDFLMNSKLKDIMIGKFKLRAILIFNLATQNLISESITKTLVKKYIDNKGTLLDEIKNFLLNFNHSVNQFIDHFIKLTFLIYITQNNESVWRFLIKSKDREELEMKKKLFLESLCLHLKGSTDNNFPKNYADRIEKLDFSDLLQIFISKSKLMDLTQLNPALRACGLETPNSSSRETSALNNSTLKFLKISVSTFAPVLHYLMTQGLLGETITKAFHSSELESALFNYIKTLESSQQEKTIQLAFQPISPFNHFFSDSTKEELKIIPSSINQSINSDEEEEEKGFDEDFTDSDEESSDVDLPPPPTDFEKIKVQSYLIFDRLIMKFNPAETEESFRSQFLSVNEHANQFLNDKDVSWDKREEFCQAFRSDRPGSSADEASEYPEEQKPDLAVNCIMYTLWYEVAVKAQWASEYYIAIYDYAKKPIREPSTAGLPFSEIYSTTWDAVLNYITENKTQETTSLSALLNQQGMFPSNSGESPAEQPGPTEEPTNGYQP